ncbi:hypothetical protein H6784_02335 [Candidatus Nomurabacteria bacterium]|nr:hypothetical protein [Candidatus Kaiserbacteria bacterium]MCB9814234.1 hypothetical protein [Candidatus Nomurabacteria bacterium]
MDMTTFVKRISVACSILLLATPLTGEVFAQQKNDITNVKATSSSTASTTELVVPIDLTQDDELWYRSERISGNIDVGDFVVGPGRTEIEVSPGETVTREITVTNRISADRSFLLEIEDITGSDDGSSAVSLTGDKVGPYSIRDFISFPEDNFTLDLGERARIPITITVPPNTSPGGYYGSVLVSTVRKADSEVSAAPRSPIIARVGSLFFLRVRGDVVIEGKTSDISLTRNKWWYEKGPIDFGILYENTGSVHVNPYGELSIKNMFGEEVGFIELEPWFVLPKSLRLREITWDREFLLGRYTATAKVNRGYDDIVDKVSVSFWVMPWKIVGGMFFVLFVIIFGIRAFFRTFEFKRKG